MTLERTDKSFLELIHRHQSILHKICFAYCNKPSDREDLQQEIDEDRITELTLKQQGMRKRRLFFMALTAIVCGLLLLAYFVFR